MPVTWEFRGAALVVTTAGKYQEQEPTQAVAEARADPRFRPGTFLLFDGSLSEAELTTESVKWRVAWNLTVCGLDWSLMVPDVRLEAGEVVLQLTKVAAPCATSRGSSVTATIRASLRSSIPAGRASARESRGPVSSG